MWMRSFYKWPNTSQSAAEKQEKSSVPVSSLNMLMKRWAQIEELEKVFKRLDVNGDGKISWSEVGKVMGSLGHNVTKEDLEKMLSEVDADTDGFIDLDEFMELNRKVIEYLNTKRAGGVAEDADEECW